jgi:hypothetical protein
MQPARSWEEHYSELRSIGNLRRSEPMPDASSMFVLFSGDRGGVRLPYARWTRWHRPFETECRYLQVPSAALSGIRRTRRWDPGMTRRSGPSFVRMGRSNLLRLAGSPPTSRDDFLTRSAAEWPCSSLQQFPPGWEPSELDKSVECYIAILDVKIIATGRLREDAPGSQRIESMIVKDDYCCPGLTRYVVQREVSRAS